MRSLKQLSVITGGFGTGKSTLAVTAARPSEMNLVYGIDGEGSMNQILRELGRNKTDLGRYVDMRDRFPDIDNRDVLASINAGKLPWVEDKKKGEALIDYWDFMLNDIDENLTPGRYKILIVDPLATMEAGMAAKVEANKREFGVRSTAYGGLWTAGVYPLYEQYLNAVWSRGVDHIIFTSHLKTPWEGTRQVTGKYTMSGKKILYRLSTFMVWLEKVRGQKAPVGLVLKDRFVSMNIDEDADEWIIESRLPERIPECTWRNIRRYLSGEWVLGERDGETMNDQERDLISPLLKDKQLDLMIAEAELETAELRAETQRAASSLPSMTPATPLTTTPDVPADLQPIVDRIRELELDHEREEVESILSQEGVVRPRILRAYKLIE